ncbi:MAG TPA: alpha/beta hydrolase [Acidimicrobiales bacterium]|nr:alpha/beta hydrolase [Acidimicrobiales bacterium]
MPVDPVLAPLLAELNKRPKQTGLSAQERRRLAAEARQNGNPYEAFVEAAPPVADEHEESIPVSDGTSIRALVYRSERACARGAAGALMAYHGGGWVGGTPDESQQRARLLAAAADVVVVNVDYRLAPEHPFPTPVQDAYDALVWTAAQSGRLAFDQHRIGVSGESAGANLAAAVALMARAHGGPDLCLQVLEIPGLDLTLSSPSVERFRNGFVLDYEELVWCMDLYMNGHDPRDPLASPVFAPDVSGLPPAVILTAECDPLTDDGRRYAELLRTAGVPVLHREFAGHLHGSHGLTALLPSAREWQSVLIDAVCDAFRAGAPDPVAAA